MKKNDRKIFVIGIDGATFKILDKLDKNGKTPYLSSLRKNAHGVLTSTIPAISAPAWVSFQTGVNPGKHSVYDFFYQKDGERQIINANDIKAEKLADYFGKAGYKTLLLNLPISYPVVPINGTLVSSFLTPKNSSFAYPIEVENYLKKIKYKIDLFLGGDSAFAPNEKLTKVQKNKILKELISIAKKRVKAFKYLYKTDDYKLSFIYFKGSDIIQHLDYDGELTEKYFVNLDKLLKDLDNFINSQCSDPYLFVLSDHGFHKSPEHEFFVDKWFRELFEIKNSNISEKTWSVFSRLNHYLKLLGLNISKYELINNYRNKLIEKANEEKFNLDGKNFRIDVKGIYLGDDYTDDEKEFILSSARLLKYKGEKVFNEVKFRENIYRGKYLKNAPDIVWITNENFVVNPLKTAKYLFGKYITNLEGEHYSDKDGVYFVKGKKIIKKNKRFNIVDILPTLMYLSNIDVPDFIDGNVMDIFSKNFSNNSIEKISDYKRLDKLVSKQFIDVRNFS